MNHLKRLGFEKTAESTGSFRATPDGRPIEFLGYTYELSRDDWQGAGALQIEQDGGVI